jgi:hypothetical protein
MGIVFGKIDVAEPSFKVLLNRASVPIPYQIRQYNVRYACETTFTGSDTSSAFRALAGYIGVMGSPQNEGSQSISMTAPVVMEEEGQSASGSGSASRSIAMTAPVVTSTSTSTSTSINTKNHKDLKKMQFFLPEEYNNLKSIPKPTNPNVTIHKIPAATGVVHTFSGTAGDVKTKHKVKALVRQLKEDGLELDEDQVVLQNNYSLWQYNPPFTIPIMRRNEVWIQLTDDEVQGLLNKFQN